MCLFKSSLMSFVAPCNFSKKLFLMTAKQAYLTRYRNSISLFNVKHDDFKHSFFPSITIEWNNLQSWSKYFETF